MRRRIPSVVKWSSRRDSNPHVAFTSRCTVGARELRVSRSGMVQFTVQSHVVQNKSFESRQGANFTDIPVYQIPRYRMWYFTCRPLYLPPYPTNAPFGIWHFAHGSIWFGSELYPLPLKASRVCHFPLRDVCSKIAITCKNGFCGRLESLKPNHHHFCTFLVPKKAQ